jgi:hypothetical protein
MRVERGPIAGNNTAQNREAHSDRVGAQLAINYRRSNYHSGLTIPLTSGNVPMARSFGVSEA